MKIEQNKVDDLNIELTLSIAKDDYSEKRKKRLNEHKRTAELKGFRKGMAPMSFIEKIYGQSCLVDAVNDIISDALNGFIKENDLKVIGEPLPAENQESVEWKNGNDFEFKFDVALSPKVDFELSKDDKRDEGEPSETVRLAGGWRGCKGRGFHHRGFRTGRDED